MNPYSGFRSQNEEIIISLKITGLSDEATLRKSYYIKFSELVAPSVTYTPNDKPLKAYAQDYAI